MKVKKWGGGSIRSSRPGGCCWFIFLVEKNVGNSAESSIDECGCSKRKVEEFCLLVRP